MSHVSNEDFIELTPHASTSGPMASLFDFEDSLPQVQQESVFENVWANFLTYVYSPVTGSKIVDHWSALAQSQLTRLIQSILAQLSKDCFQWQGTYNDRSVLNFHRKTYLIFFRSNTISKNKV